MSEQKRAEKADDSVRVRETQADHVHGNTKIKPGDRVEYESRMCRVIEVHPKDDISKLKVYRTGGMHSGVKTIYAEAVTDYEPRD